MGKRKLILTAILTITLIEGIALYAFFALSDGDYNIGTIISIIIPLIIIVFMFFFIVRRYKDIKSGLPLEDERSRKVITMAAAKSFYVSLYWLLAISWFDDLFAEKLFGIDRLTASQAIGGGIAGMALLFFGFWIYYDKRGKLV